MRVTPYAVLLTLAGCSAINSFDDVKPAVSASNGGKSGNETGGTGNAGDGGADSGSGTGGTDASVGGTSGGAGGAGTGGSKAGAGGGGRGGGGAGGSGGATGGASSKDGGADVFVPGGPTGAIVTYNGALTEKKLYVLDPDTGKPFSSEPMGKVRAISNDGAPDPTDHWFIFEETGPIDQGVKLHVRSLDTSNGLWKEHSTLAAVPPPFSRVATFGSNNKAFLAYLTDPTPLSPTGGLNSELVVIEVTDPKAPLQMVLPDAIKKLPAGNKIGLMGDLSSLNVVIVQSTNCPTDDAGVPACEVSVAHFLVSSSGVTAGAQPPVGVTSSSGNVVFTDDPYRNTDMIAFPSLTLPTAPTCTQSSRTSGSVRTSSIGQPANAISTVSVPIEMTQFAANGATFDICDNVIFLTSVINDIAIWAVPLGGTGTLTKLCQGEAGSRLIYEPYTHSLFRGVNTTSVDVFTVDTKSGPAPLLKDKFLTQLPANFQFGAMAVRSPNRPTCQ